MAEALAAFSIACNVFQTIGFALETAPIFKRVFQTGSLDPALGASVEHTIQATKSLSDSINGAPKHLDDDARQLLDIANACHDVASQLKTEIDKTSSGPSAKGKIVASIKRTMKATIAKKRTEKLEKALRSHQTTLESGLFMRLW